jgi:DNA-binding NarL/FixJ family response regulator
MLGRNRPHDPLNELTPRERDVLAAMAEGKSNRGIADELVITEAAVEKHVTRIFHKLDLGATPNEHRRVLAVLTYLRG